jgi:hypothetical protein
LFDLNTDPDEMVNVAAEQAKNNDLILMMNTKLENIDQGRNWEG